MPKVVILTNSLTGGGAERSMNILANELGNRGLDITLIAINDGPEDAVKLAIPFIGIGKTWQGSFANTAKSFLVFKSILKNLRPDIVIANCDLPEFFLSLTPGKFRIIVTEHVSRPWHTRKSLGIVTRSILKLRKAHWVAVSDYLQIWPWRIAPEKVLRNGVLLPAQMKCSPNQELKRLIFIGRLVEQKNPAIVIQLSDLLRIPAILIGDGPLMSDLRNYCSLNSSNVAFLGMQRNPWGSVNPGDLLVVPSNWEGDGLVVVEALSAGIPILLTNISEFKNFNLDEMNYCENLDEFTNKLIRFRDDINRLIPSIDNRKKALLPRNIQQIGQEWYNFFELIE